MASELRGMPLLNMTPDQFIPWVKHDVSTSMGAWRPMGVTLHNTGTNTHWTKDTTPIQAKQLVRNMSVTWAAQGWSAGPHLVIGPDGTITVSWPLNKPGIHSPSYNHTFWGLEMVGDFDKEAFTPTQEHAVTIAMASLYAMLGHIPSDSTFHLHKEDPRSSHKRCPGVNCGDKKTWLARIDNAMHLMSPLGH